MCRFSWSLIKAVPACLGALIIGCVTPVACPAQEGNRLEDSNGSPVIDVGSTKQLFIDEKLIASKSGIQLVMHSPRKDGHILLAADEPWEAGGYIAVYSSVLREGETTRVWYDLLTPTGDGPYDHERRVCYAESADGLHFEKPHLGLHDVNGSRANNVVLPGVIGGCAVWIDPLADDAHRYKTQTKVYPSGQLHMHSSPDGLHWTKFARLDPGPGGWDTQNIVFRDSTIERYVLFTRYWDNNDDRRRRFRTVRRLESDDLKTWDHQSIVLRPDEDDLGTHDTPGEQPPVDYYGATVIQYEGVYLMLAQAFWHWYSRPQVTGLGPSTFDVRLAVSRDGTTFHRVGGWKPFLSTGPDGRFDSRFVWAMPNPVRMGDELWIYYVGSNRDHDRVVDPASNGQHRSGVSRAVLRLDGFVSASAGYEGGQLTTPLIRFHGSSLTLNVDTGAGGSVKVELLDDRNQPLAGYSGTNAIPVVGNSVRLPVTWTAGSDVSHLSGQAVRLRFTLQECQLYAFQFTD